MSENEQENRQTQTLSAKENVIQFVKIGLFSASAGLIQFLTFTLLTEFLFNRFVVYRGSMNTRDDVKKENPENADA